MMDYLLVCCTSMTLFILGLIGVVIHRKNIILVLASMELLLLAVNYQWVGTSAFMRSLDGQVFSLFIIALAACESALGLAILILVYRQYQHVDAGKLNQLRS